VKTLSIFLLALFASFLLLNLTPKVQANESLENVEYEKINPGNVFYPLKRLSEKTRKKFTSGEGRKEFMYTLLERRYKELIYLAKNKKLGQMETSTSRFMTQLGEILDTNSVLIERKELINEYRGVLMKARDLYESNSAYWLFLQQSLDLSTELTS